MSDLNACQYTGRLGRDPEIRTTGDGTKVANFSLAVERSFKNKAGEREVDWIPIVAWRKAADLAEKYCRKGDRIAVVGSTQIRTYEADDGSKRKVYECVADRISFLGGGKKQDQAPPPGPPDDDGPGDDDLPF